MTLRCRVFGHKVVRDSPWGDEPWRWEWPEAGTPFPRGHCDRCREEFVWAPMGFFVSVGGGR